MKTRVVAIGAGVAAMALASFASAQTVEPRTTDEMRQKTRELGISIGNTYACLSDEARATLRVEAHVIFDMILKDVGSDLAWAYATGTGYGASLPTERLDCEALEANYAQIRIDFGLIDDEGAAE